MESWLYNPELEMMRWRLQMLAMGLQHQSSLPAPFVPFHLQQPGPEFPAMSHQFPQAGAVKQEPVEPQVEAGSSPPSLLYRPAFQTRSGSVSPPHSGELLPLVIPLLALPQLLQHQPELLVPRQGRGAE